MRLLLNPRSATVLSAGTINSYALSPEAARQIVDSSTTELGRPTS
jgi:hypothetical protein